MDTPNTAQPASTDTAADEQQADSATGAGADAGADTAAATANAEQAVGLDPARHQDEHQSTANESEAALPTAAAAPQQLQKTEPSAQCRKPKRTVAVLASSKDTAKQQARVQGAAKDTANHTDDNQPAAADTAAAGTATSEPEVAGTEGAVATPAAADASNYAATAADVTLSADSKPAAAPAKLKPGTTAVRARVMIAQELAALASSTPSAAAAETAEQAPKDPAKAAATAAGDARAEPNAAAPAGVAARPPPAKPAAKKAPAAKPAAAPAGADCTTANTVKGTSADSAAPVVPAKPAAKKAAAAKPAAATAEGTMPQVPTASVAAKPAVAQQPSQAAAAAADKPPPALKLKQASHAAAGAAASASAAGGGGSTSRRLQALLAEGSALSVLPAEGSELPGSRPPAQLHGTLDGGGSDNWGGREDDPEQQEILKVFSEIHGTGDDSDEEDNDIVRNMRAAAAGPAAVAGVGNRTRQTYSQTGSIQGTSRPVAGAVLDIPTALPAQAAAVSSAAATDMPDQQDGNIGSEAGSPQSAAGYSPEAYGVYQTEGVELNTDDLGSLGVLGPEGLMVLGGQGYASGLLGEEAGRDDRGTAIAEQLAQLHEDSRRLQVQSQVLQQRAFEMTMHMAAGSNANSSAGDFTKPQNTEGSSLMLNPAAMWDQPSHSSVVPLSQMQDLHAVVAGFQGSAGVPGFGSIEGSGLQQNLVEGSAEPAGGLQQQQQQHLPGDATPNLVSGSNRVGLNWNIPSRGSIPSPLKLERSTPSSPSKLDRGFVPGSPSKLDRGYSPGFPDRGAQYSLSTEEPAPYLNNIGLPRFSGVPGSQDSQKYPLHPQPAADYQAYSHADKHHSNNSSLRQQNPMKTRFHDNSAMQYVQQQQQQHTVGAPQHCQQHSYQQQQYQHPEQQHQQQQQQQQMPIIYHELAAHHGSVNHHTDSANAYSISTALHHATVAAAGAQGQPSTDSVSSQAVTCLPHAEHLGNNKRSLNGSHSPGVTVRKAPIPFKNTTGTTTRVAAAGNTAGRRASHADFLYGQPVIEEMPVVGTFATANAVNGAVSSNTKVLLSRQAAAARVTKALDGERSKSPGSHTTCNVCTSSSSNSPHASRIAAAAEPFGPLGHKGSSKSINGGSSPTAAALAAAGAHGSHHSAPAAAAAPPWAPVGPYTGMYGGFGGFNPAAVMNPVMMAMMQMKVPEQQQGPKTARGQTNRHKTHTSPSGSAPQGCNPALMPPIDVLMPGMPIGLPPGFMGPMGLASMPVQSIAGPAGGINHSTVNKTARERGGTQKESLVPVGPMVPGGFAAMPFGNNMGALGAANMGFAAPEGSKGRQRGPAAGTAAGGVPPGMPYGVPGMALFKGMPAFLPGCNPYAPFNLTQAGGYPAAAAGSGGIRNPVAKQKATGGPAAMTAAAAAALGMTLHTEYHAGMPPPAHAAAGTAGWGWQQQQQQQHGAVMPSMMVGMGMLPGMLLPGMMQQQQQQGAKVRQQQRSAGGADTFKGGWQ